MQTRWCTSIAISLPKTESHKKNKRRPLTQVSKVFPLETRLRGCLPFSFWPRVSGSEIAKEVCICIFHTGTDLVEERTWLRVLSLVSGGIEASSVRHLMEFYLRVLGLALHRARESCCNPLTSNWCGCPCPYKRPGRAQSGEMHRRSLPLLSSPSCLSPFSISPIHLLPQPVGGCAWPRRHPKLDSDAKASMVFLFLLLQISHSIQILIFK